MMLFGFISVPFTAILDKLIITGIALAVGLVIDIIIWIISYLKDNTSDSGFGIDWGA